MPVMSKSHMNEKQKINGYFRHPAKYGTKIEVTYYKDNKEDMKKDDFAYTNRNGHFNNYAMGTDRRICLYGNN